MIFGFLLCTCQLLRNKYYFKNLLKNKIILMKSDYAVKTRAKQPGEGFSAKSTINNKVVQWTRTMHVGPRRNEVAFGKNVR